MTDYISREAAIEALEQNWNPDTEFEAVIGEIPAADVRPVVLCRDCKNYIERSGACAYLVVGMREDDFCSYGKKREES